MNKIFLYKYTYLNYFEVAQKIEKILKDEGEPLTPEQSAALSRGLEYQRSGDGFQAYEWEKPKKEGKNLLWRLSTVFLILIGFVAMLFRPIHWICTGRWDYESNDSLFVRFILRWYQKIFE